MVVILDPRVKTKPYGRTFLESLPNCRRVDRANRRLIQLWDCSPCIHFEWSCSSPAAAPRWPT